MIKFNLGLGAGIMAVAVGFTYPIAIILGLFAYGFTRGTVSPSITYVSFQIAGEGSGGQATGILSVGLFGGLGIGAFTAGLMIDHFGSETALFLIPVLIAISFIISLTMNSPGDE